MKGAQMPESTLVDARKHFIQGLSRISNFWGFPKAMGAVYGAIYLSPDPITLDQLVEQAGVSKGAVSTNVRQLERLNMVHRHLIVGDRKDYYTAETDFWKMIKSILQQREQNEFDKALGTVSESLEMTAQAEEDPELSAFYNERMGAMQSFFETLDSLVSAAMALEGLVSLSAVRNMLVKAGKK
jgi:DNA-binding transcriptional regulator GbsR (MarR family)